MNINDIGLNVLGWVKKIRGQSVDLTSIEDKNTSTIHHQIWSELLKKYVSTTGKVNYVGFIEDGTKLSEYLALLSNNPPGKNWADADKLAYWINAYNAFTVKLIIDNYPLKSIKDIASGLPMINSPWDIKFFKIGNTPFDLNTIEHEILRKQFKEPRIHFAINCASVSCPILLNEAYESSRLNEQLNKQAIYFINNPKKNIIQEKEAKLSSIFNWFNKDFTNGNTLIGFVNQFSKTTIEQGTKVEFLEYDWNLNE